MGAAHGFVTNVSQRITHFGVAATHRTGAVGHVNDAGGMRAADAGSLRIVQLAQLDEDLVQLSRVTGADSVHALSPPSFLAFTRTW